MNAFLKKLRLGSVLAGILIMGLWLPVAHAGVAVAPLKQELSLKPGEEGKVTLILSYINRAQSETKQKMQITLQDVQATEEGSLAFKDAGASRTSASSWITLPSEDIELDPGQSKTIECTIKVPMAAMPGEYYSVAMVTLGQKGVNEKGVAVQYRIASGIFVTVLGRTFPKEAKITQCELVWPQAAPETASTQPAGTQAAKPPEMPSVRLILQNTGQARFDATGKITIYDEKQRWVLTSPFATKRPTVFGGDSRLFAAPITKALAAGKYTIRVEMDYESSWAKARQEMHVEVLPTQAELLAAAKKNEHAQAAAIESSVPSIAATLPAGASRTLAIALKGLSDGSVTCSPTVIASTAGGETWLNVSAESFVITKGAKKTLVVNVDVPATAPSGKYSSTLLVDASVEGSSPSQISIPVDIEVKAGR